MADIAATPHLDDETAAVLVIGVAAALFVLNRTTYEVGSMLVTKSEMTPEAAFDAADHFVSEARKRYG